MSKAFEAELHCKPARQACLLTRRAHLGKLINAPLHAFVPAILGCAGCMAAYATQLVLVCVGAVVSAGACEGMEADVAEETIGEGGRVGSGFWSMHAAAV